jgi:hypothetical protein
MVAPSQAFQYNGLVLEPARGRQRSLPGGSSPSPRKSGRLGDSSRALRWVRTVGDPRSAKIVRLVTDGRPPRSLAEAERILFDALGRVRSNREAFLLLPGGYIRAEWPSCFVGHPGWNPPAAALVQLEQATRDAVQRLLSLRVRRRCGNVRAIAIGVDTACNITGTYAEMIAFYETRRKSLAITGKSLPRSDQVRLVRVADLSSHFVQVGRERILLLGCHDLNFFSPRGRGRQATHGRLARLRREMDRQVSLNAPHVVLQLPHGTDTPRTWSAAWNALNARCSTIRAWASGISYYNIYEQEPRAALVAVLAGTHGGAPCADLLYGLRV